MKVIDLLQRMANGEELPRKFMVDGDTLYIGEDKYIEYESGKKIKWLIYPSWLNEEVEIIEEDKKIEKLNDNNFGSTYAVFNKINEIIDKINEMEDK